MAKIVQAVECEVCHELHTVGNGRYLELEGKLTITNGRQHGQDYVKHLGKPDDRSIVCQGGLDNYRCLLAFLGLKDS